MDADDTKDFQEALFHNFDTIVDQLSRITTLLEEMKEKLEAIETNTNAIGG
jgi:hypothetical protein